MIGFRNCDRRWPFLWESALQPAARWHGDGEGPVQYIADTPDGAWAEFLRHEEIDDPADLAGVERAIWSIEFDADDAVAPGLPVATMIGDGTYGECQAEARRLRREGAGGVVAPSAAMHRGSAGGYRVEHGFRPGNARDARVFVLFGPRPTAVGWQIVDSGRPPSDVLHRVRHFSLTP